MRHIGDVTKVNGADIEPVDCITFGSPCQGLSNAGLREGLNDERSGLFTEAVRIIKEMRNNERNKLSMRGTDNNVRPRYAIWENVPGALSCNDGEDFRTVLEELCRIREPNATIPRLKDSKGNTAKWTSAGSIEGNGFSIAWRVMDSQYWGVPQRRKRLCVLCDFNGYTATECLLTDFLEYHRETLNRDTDSPALDSSARSTPNIQFESEGVRWNIKQSITPWKGVAKCPEGSTFGVANGCYTLKLRHTGTDTRGGELGH